MSGSGNEYAYSLAGNAAILAIAQLLPACRRIEIAGSLRRKEAIVHDVDLVVWPKTELTNPQLTLFATADSGQPEAVELKRLVQEIGVCEHFDAQYPRIIKLRLRKATGDLATIPIELYIAEPDGSNFDALLQLRTGSAQFNQLLAERAKKINLKYSAGHGIYKGNARVDDGTEAGIFAALGMQYLEPEQRSGIWETFHAAREVKNEI